MTDTPGTASSTSSPPRPKRPWTILGRLSRAVREQNWFAVALELAIVVLGVVIGFQVTSWGNARAERTQEQAYLRQLAADLDQMEANYHALAEIEARSYQRGLRAYRILSRPEISESARDTVSLDLVRLMNRRTMSVTDATYQDLLSTGGLRVLRNQELRNELVSFYEEVERAVGIHNKNNEAVIDNLFVHELVSRGLIYNTPTSSIAGASRLAGIDSTLQADLSPGYGDRSDPMWRRPASAVEWDVVRSLLLERIWVAAISSRLAEVQLDAIQDTKRAVEAELK